MKKVLTINCGSSTIKYRLFDMESEKELVKGNCSRIGSENSSHELETSDGRKATYKVFFPTHLEAIQSVLASLTVKEVGVISSLDEIDAIGHRVVQGGSVFKDSTLIDEKVTEQIEELAQLAPLHNKAHAIGIRMCRKALPNVPMVAVFDTSFHQTMPPEAYMYALPYEMCEEYKIRKYGAHGTSHKFVATKAAQILGKDLKDLKIIVCHLGNGSSITVVNGGKSVDTSMGFTPLDGLMMGTRCGSIDPAIIPYIVQNAGVKVDELNDFLNNECGIKGISGVSNDFRDIKAAIAENNSRAKLALDMFIYQVRKYIGAYTAVLNGIDALVFTAGVGENDSNVRKGVCENMDALGVEIDAQKNAKNEVDITGANSKVKVLVIRTNEELMIAKETMRLVK